MRALSRRNELLGLVNYEKELIPMHAYSRSDKTMPPKPSAKPRVTVEELTAATSPDGYVQLDLIDRYRKQTPTIDAIPILRKVLANTYNHAIVKCAAESLGKIGPDAIDAIDDLLRAAVHTEGWNDLPQSYPECIEAMVAIQPSHPELVPLIKNFVGLDNWIPISASLRALKAIGTPAALDLLQRMARFWEPELNKMQRRVVEQILTK